MSIINGGDETQNGILQGVVRQQTRDSPARRPGEPEEVARVAVFLASDDCSYITGDTLVVDGLTITL